MTQPSYMPTTCGRVAMIGARTVDVVSIEEAQRAADQFRFMVESPSMSSLREHMQAALSEIESAIRGAKEMSRG